MTVRMVLAMAPLLLLLAGCGVPHIQQPPQADARYANPVMAQAPLKAEEGSLWTESVETALYTEFRARRVGDIVTVRIVEDPKAELNANTKTSRQSNVQARMEFLGLMKKLSEQVTWLPQYPDNLIEADISSSHDGSGKSTREGSVKAYVACVVERIFPNGYLYIRGKREIWVNNEKQYLLLSGTIRPEDINSRNEVASTYVADAEIVYAGVGPVADKQQPGWLGRIVDYVWPF